MPWKREGKGVEIHGPSPKCQARQTHIIFLIFTAIPGLGIEVIAMCLLSAFKVLPH